MFSGSIVALVTPMFENGDIDFESFAALIDWHLAEQTDGFVIGGSTGESGGLTRDESRKLLDFAVKQVRKRVPVIGGVATTSTHHASQAAEAVMDAGADAALVLAPPYVKPTQEGLFQHYQYIAKQVGFPIILYNVPGRTACDILPETAIRLAKISNIVGIKEATGDIARVNAIKAAVGNGLEIYSGDDGTALELLLAGGRGVISVTANAAPRLMHNMVIAALEGSLERARALQDQLMPLHHALFQEANPIPLKWALHTLKKIPPGIRLPLTTLSVECQSAVRQALQVAECI